MNEDIDRKTSALKLYQQAYHLHYKEHNLAEACTIYEELIQKFPDADVSAYASIQLEKIHASDVARKMARRSSVSLPLRIMLCINVLLLIAIGGFASYHVVQIRTERAMHTKLSRALGKMYAGKDDEALDMLREIKIRHPQDMTPFALSAEIYRKNNDYLRARKEYETYRRLNPQDPLPETEIAVLNDDEDLFIKKAMKKAKKEIPEDFAKDAERKAAQRANASERRSRVTAPVRKKVKLLVPPDSLKYF